MLKRSFRELSVAGAALLLLAFLGVFAPGFFQTQPLLSLFTREIPLLVVACGMALVILTRQIDISVGSVFAVCGVCAGLLAEQGWPLPLVVIGSVLTGALFGAVNGLFVAGLGLPSIVVTLATMVAWREGLRWLREGRFVDLPAGTQWFGLSQMNGQLFVLAIGMAVLVAAALGLRRLAVGRFFYAVGSDAEAARLAGVNPRWVTFAAFVLIGALTGLAAMLNLAQSPQVDPKSGTGMELEVIAAVVVGGVAISGGRGTPWGVFAGFVLLTCIGPALTHLRIEAFWEKAIQGAIILLAVVADGLRERREGGKR